MASLQFKESKRIPGTEQGSSRPVFLTTASHEFMMIEVWNIANSELLALKYYPSFEDFKQKISLYFRTKRFGLNMRTYLLSRVLKCMLNGMCINKITWSNYSSPVLLIFVIELLLVLILGIELIENPTGCSYYKF